MSRRGCLWSESAIRLSTFDWQITVVQLQKFVVGKRAKGMAKPPPTEYPIYEDVDDATHMAAEDRLWWIVGRKAILKTLLDLAVKTRPVRTIFEIGCGSGNSFDLLSKYGRIIACDASPVQVRRARARGMAAEVFLTENCFQHTFSEPFQLTCFFDVLEHVEDDVDFLAQLNQLVEPGHLVLLSVPACPALFPPMTASCCITVATN